MPHAHAEPRPFRLEIPESALAELEQRLRHTRLPDAQPVDDWSQGVPLAYARELLDYWENAYDWQRCEDAFNAWPQFLLELDGLDIHFLHVRSPQAEALPLLLTHGWPGSVREFLEVIPLLSDPVAHGGSAAEAFHLVIPSLPGYGFSSAPRSTGVGAERIAQLWDRLMRALGYTRYVAQGGDWGSIVSHEIALLEDSACIGMHTNMPMVGPEALSLDDLTAREQRALDHFGRYRAQGSAYLQLQATRPQTLGYALADSPVGQMSWIVEKFQEWTDCERDGVRHVEHAVSRDALLDNVMLYWLNNCAASSARLYWESALNTRFTPIDTPVACSVFPHEIFPASERWVRGRYRQLIHYNELERGGHFAALEQPELFAAELRTAFAGLRG